MQRPARRFRAEASPATTWQREGAGRRDRAVRTGDTANHRHLPTVAGCRRSRGPGRCRPPDTSSPPHLLDGLERTPCCVERRAPPSQSVSVPMLWPPLGGYGGYCLSGFFLATSGGAAAAFSCTSRRLLLHDVPPFLLAKGRHCCRLSRRRPSCCVARGVPPAAALGAGDPAARLKRTEGALNSPTILCRFARERGDARVATPAVRIHVLRESACDKLRSVVELGRGEDSAPPEDYRREASRARHRTASIP